MLWLISSNGMWLAWCGAQARQYLPPASPRDAQAQPGARKVTLEAGSGAESGPLLVHTWSLQPEHALQGPVPGARGCLFYIRKRPSQQDYCFLFLKKILFIYLFIFGCVGSSLLHAGFL